MKHKFSKQFISALLALVMVIGMIPASVLTVSAADKTEVEQIETRISAEHVPYAGKDYSDLYTKDDSDIYRSAQNSGSEWMDDTGMTIDIKGDGAFGEWYNIRYQFEAGRTYTAEYTYQINSAYEETYKFTENTKVVLTNPDPSKCTIVGEVTEVRDFGRIIDVLYTMTIAGERSYSDIEAVTLQKITTPADGVWIETTALMYSNCTLTSQAWSPNVSTFEAGNSYTLTVNLHANDGYKFSDSFAPVLGIKGYEKAADTVELLNDNKDAVVSFTYNVGDYNYIDTLWFDTNKTYSIFVPTRETSGQGFTFPFNPAENSQFENRIAALGYSDTTYWYNETDGYEMDNTKTFEAGKVYSISTVFDIKKDLLAEYRFANNATAVINGNGFTTSGYRVECKPDGTSIIVKFFFTAQFPDGEGSNANNPAMCYSYDEFKYAMESADIRYVALGNVEDMLPAIPHDEEIDPDGITTTAIVVRGHKDLNLLGNAVFRCPLTGNYDLKYYVQLLTLTDAADSSLYIHGDGSLTYEGGTLYFVNSAITVDGGHLTVDGATVRGSNGNHTGYCYGINARYGSVSIQNGANIIGEVYGGDDGICALVIGEEGEYRSLSVSIFDGKFYVERDTGDGSEDYGIAVWNDCGLRIYGMTSDGIELNRYAADTLDDYVMDGTVMTVNGVKTNPASCGTTNGIVEVFQEISEVDLAINSPAAGDIPVIYPEEVYRVPDGCTVESVVWYENGALWNTSTGAARFEAGSTYRVDIILSADDNVRFANPLASATINYEKATVSSHGGNAQKSIVLSVDLGECADAISLVELTVTAPAEGQKPSYTVGCASNSYIAAGNNQNYTEYRKWYMSSDGDDWWEINGTHTFMSGYYYKFIVDIQTKSGYEFPLYDNGISIVPDVSATVNGYYANVTKGYEQDPSRYITVEYNFGECSDSIIEKIIVENVTAPVAGEKPNYTYSIRGGGYQMNTAKNAYEDIYWKNPPEQWYYIKNGIGWFDLTEGDWVYENETFIAGHEYNVNVYLKADDGYEFKLSKWLDIEFTASINGFSATGIDNSNECRTQQTISNTFICESKKITTVMVNGLSEPRAGETPDYTASVANPEWYQIDPNYAGTNGIVWYDNAGNQLEPTDSFVAGEIYKVEIKLIPTQLGGANISQFVPPVTAYVNGKQVTENDDWDTVFGSATAVYIYYTFPKGAIASEHAHNYGEYVYNGDATEQKDGTKTRVCSVCGKKDTVTAEGTKWTNPFSDVESKDYFYTPVLWAVANNITAGTSQTTFSPSAPCIRGQIVTFLWRTAGCPTPKTSKMPFKDVDSKAYYYDAVLWAVENGITAGTSATTFSPDDPCTRGQIVTFLWRSQNSPDATASNPFKDVDSKAYYYDAVLWAVENKITSGTSVTTFAPNDPCTRGQIVTFLYRAYTNGKTEA